jgi:thiol-disulfide isomerase/thioredoxin
MNKKILLIAATVFILSCSILPPQKAEPTTALPAPTDAPQTGASPAGTANDTLTGFMEVRLHPQDGNLEEMLAVEAGKAIAAGLLPVVEFDADWCPPCQAINQHLEAKNDLMLKAYDGTYIIKLDVDEWGWNNGRVESFSFEAIPIYFKLNEQGKQTGDVIDGGAWNEDIPVNIAPVMDAFFHGG